MQERIEKLYPKPADDEERLKVLSRYDVVGTAPEPRFDEVARLATRIFNVPIAFVSLVDQHRQWLKSHIGVDFAETPRCESFCTHTIMGADVLVINDAAQDPRFAATDLVTGRPNVRFYAGAPIVAQGGHRLGSLCIMDTEPRERFEAADGETLKHLAKIVMGQLDLRRLEFVNAAMRGFAEATELALLTIDRHGLIEFVNTATEGMFGYDPKAMIGRSFEIVIPERFRGSYLQSFKETARTEPARLSRRTLELTMLRCDGSEFPAELSLSAWGSDRGVGFGAIMRDISARRMRDARLLRMATHDTLTGLPNRAKFEALLGALLGRGEPASVLLLDLDGFKEINDRFGHGLGDTLLQALAIRLPVSIGRDGVLARFGGDEFAILLPRIDRGAGLAACARAIGAAFEEPFIISGHTLHLGVSVGAATAPGHGCDVGELVASADFALYRAKQAGGRRFRLFDDRMRSAVAAERSLRDELRRAVDRNEFVLHYQPQVDLRTGAVTGAEALIRWHHPDRGLLLPGVFLPCLEDSSLALDVGWWSLDEACRQAMAWRAVGLPPLRMAVNLFAAQFRVGTLASGVMETLARHAFPASDLELEVTETIALRQDDDALAPISELRSHGVRIAFDDFGTGYASLSTLKRVPLTKLKIDRSFVRDLLTDPHDAAIVSSVVMLGRSLGLEVIAEGIETEEQERALLALGCEAGQGYRFGKPMAPERLAERLGHQRPRQAA